MTVEKEIRELMVEVRTLRREVRHVQLTLEAGQRGQVAPVEDMGDPKIRFNPKDWSGPSFKGRPTSEAPPEFLDHYARALHVIAEGEKRDNKLWKRMPVFRFTLLQAARARRWALRRRMGWEPPPEPEPPAEAPSPFGKREQMKKGEFPFGHNADPEDDADMNDAAEDPL